MAKIKVKFRQSTVKGRPGTIYYQICHRQEHRHITTKMHIMPEELNDKGDGAGMSTYNLYYNQIIEHDLFIIHHIIKDFETSNIPYTTTDIINRFRSMASKVNVLDYMHTQICILQNNRKYGTAENYRCAMNSMETFLNHHDLSFCLFNQVLVNEYNKWLQVRNVRRNSISFYMRIWRSVYNKAVKEKITTQPNPFADVYTGVEHTAKRAVSEDTILRLARLDLEQRPPLRLARDLFIFSYCTRGMAFVDIAFLKKTNIHNGILTYTRRKTSQELSIYIEPCIQHIIDRYEARTKDSEYIFPILTATDELTARQQYHTALCYHNRKLKKLAEMAGINTNITSYTSRHSWATTARNHNIPLSVISAGMGHTSEKTTEIYLASLQNSVIDEANKNVLKDLNRCTSC